MIFTQGGLDTRVPPPGPQDDGAGSGGLLVWPAGDPPLPAACRARGGRSRVQDRAMDTAFLMMQLGMSYGEEGRHDIGTDEDWPSAATSSGIAFTARPTDG